MKTITLGRAKRIEGEVTVPADKSISHRAAMFNAIAEGTATIDNFLMAEDCLSTVVALKSLGAAIEINGNRLKVRGVGLGGLKKPKDAVYCGNSGTTMRLLSGILAGCDFETTLTGDKSLSGRPMKRLAEPLRRMGAEVKGDYAPLTIRGGALKAIDYVSPVASAQVKSCVLLAGLYAKGVTKVTEPSASRDHTERMLKSFGAGIKVEGLSVSIEGGAGLKAQSLTVPSDISSAAFFVVAAGICGNSTLTIKNVGINPTRTGVLDVLKKMQAKIKITNRQSIAGLEPAADLVVQSANLKAVTVKGGLIPATIDELPVIMTAATQAEGTTRINGAGELRLKETDRINSMLRGLKSMGADITVEGDDILINGPSRLKGAVVSSFGDHRTAMALAVAALAADGETTIEDTDCINISFPGFEQALCKITHS